MSEAKKKHNEAFALMWYACTCGHCERVWNSRDGVTPFGLQCPSCGGNSLYHVRWDLDHAAPKHKLHNGQRFFRDGTAEEAIRVVERRIAQAKAAKQPIPEDIAKVLLTDARMLSGEWHEGWPTIDRHENTTQ